MWTLGNLTATNKQCKLLLFGHVCQHDTLSKPYYRERWNVVATEEDCISNGGQHERVDRPVTVVTATLCRRQKPAGSHHYRRSVCRSTPSRRQSLVVLSVLLFRQKVSCTFIHVCTETETETLWKQMR